MAKSSGTNEPVGTRAARIIRRGAIGAACVAGAAAIIAAVIGLRKPGTTVSQTMTNSPNGVQAGHDVNINTDRHIGPDVGAKIVAALKPPCKVTAGTISPGEGTRLGEEFLELARTAGCEANGVNLGIGFQPFDGVQLQAPRDADRAPEQLVQIQAELAEAGIASEVVRGPNVDPGSIYFYVGFKPRT